MKMKKKLLGTFLLLAMVIIFLPCSNIHKNGSSEGINTGSSTALSVDLTQSEAISLADSIIAFTVNSVKSDTSSNKDICNVVVSEDLKGSMIGNIEVYADAESLAKRKTYLAFVATNFPVTVDHPYNVVMNEYLWSVDNDSLDSIPEAFSEIKSFALLKKTLSESTSIAKKSNKAVAIQKF